MMHEMATRSFAFYWDQSWVAQHMGITLTETDYELTCPTFGLTGSTETTKCSLVLFWIEKK